MGFLEVNGLRLAIQDGSWEQEPIQVGDLFERTLSGLIAEGRGTQVRRWRCTTDPYANAFADADEVEKLLQFLEGRGQAWNFDSSLTSYSGQGVGNDATGSVVTRSSVSGKHGGRITVNSGSVFGVRCNNKLGVPKAGWTPAMGYSVFVHRKFVAGEGPSAGWHDVLLTGTVEYARNAAGGFPPGLTQYIDGALAPSIALARSVAVQSVDPFVGLHGYNVNTNAAAAVEFDDLTILPFVVPPAWVPQLTTFRSISPDSLRPRMKITGDAIRDTDPVQVIIRYARARSVQGFVEGQRNNLRAIDLVLEEWGR
jgi:hypothetical protein